MKYKTLFYLFGSLSLLLLFWNIFLFSNISGIQDQLEEAVQKKEAAEGFNEVVSYDLETCRDSMLLLKREIDSLGVNSVAIY